MLRRIFSLLNVQWSGDYYHLCLFGLLYYVAVIIGLESRVEAVALFWPANGVAFGFFLIKPSKQWLHYICVMSLGYIIGMYATGDYSWTIMFGALAANIIQTVSGTALVRYFLPGKITFATVKEIITILFLTSIAGSMISACFSVSILGAGFMKTPFELWASGVIDNAGSTIMALPLVLLLLTSSNFSFKNIIEYSNTYKTIEFLVLIITTFLLTEYVFSLEASTTSLTRTLPYLLLPCVLWSALRFSGITVALLVLFVGTEAVRHTVIGQGPFSDTYSGFILVLTLHLYISVTMITGLLFSALIKQQQMTMYSLAGSIAHEVRTPLSQVLYQLYKLEQSYEERVSHSNVEKKEKWQDTKNTVLHGLQVIDMILNETKGNLISLGNLEYISAKDATLSAVENYAYRNQYERSRVQVSVDKDFTLKIERMLFDHIVFNLLKNALYYISHYPEANIAVTVRGDVHYNTIEVQDTGPGIEKEKIPMLFNEFYSDKKSGGTGLGLSYCKRTMKAFGGDILCDSVKEEYTKFTLIFPKTKGNAEPSEVGKLKVCSESESCNGLAGKTILYVDDEEINHMILNEAFENMNVEILNVFSVDDAMKALAKVECHAIIADLNMPYKSGIDLVREIRSNRKLGLQSIPVIGLGGDPSFIATRACLDAGMNVYLHKPLNKTKLMEALCYHLNPELAKEKQLKAAED
ncbi:MASE1 domain-containing protein [Agarilytica rhodophyticola]|uniref:MASE1 domain-containing protein n=1 Tax=Agarilytica rhodophyticola TaxID=1737490 RepID=UPI000B341676|nr:ATP-binding protein [Agarilytica rhodophyticola]